MTKIFTYILIIIYFSYLILDIIYFANSNQGKSKNISKTEIERYQRNIIIPLIQLAFLTIPILLVFLQNNLEIKMTIFNIEEKCSNPDCQSLYKEIKEANIPINCFHNPYLNNLPLNFFLVLGLLILQSLITTLYHLQIRDYISSDLSHYNTRKKTYYYGLYGLLPRAITIIIYCMILLITRLRNFKKEKIKLAQIIASQKNRRDTIPEIIVSEI